MINKEDNKIKADICLNQEEFSLAKFYYKQAKKEDLNDVYLWKKELETSVLMGDEEYSLNLINEMKIRFPEEYYPWHIEYIIAAGKDDMDVDKILQQAENLFCENINYQYDKFIFYAGTERYLEAIKIAEEYLEKEDKVFLMIAEELADIYFLTEDENKAEIILEKALQLDSNVVFSIKLIQYKLLKGKIEDAKKICMEIQDEEFITKVLKKLVYAYLLDDCTEKNICLDDVIMFCKVSNIGYPYRLSVDLLCAIAYYLKNDKDNALEILNYISCITDNKTKEVFKLKSFITQDKTDGVIDKKQAINTYIWELILSIFVQDRDGGI